MAQVSVRIFVSLAIALILAALAVGMLFRPQAMRRWMTTGSRARFQSLQEYFGSPEYAGRMRSIGLIAALCAAVLIYNTFWLLWQL
jgi:hypothetical protein